jgi:2-hydroxychromene-2-carboxylate isomerase
MSKACSKLGLDYSLLKLKAKENEHQLIKQIEQNQNDQKLAGHHGVPLLVYKNQIFFGQDRFDDFKKILIEDGLLSE